MGIFTKGINKAAYQGKLTCPALNERTLETCGSSALRFVENLNPYLLRYRCRKCGKTFLYDISGRSMHPYVPTQKQLVGFMGSS